MICMLIPWLAMLRQTAETSIGTSIVNKNEHTQVPLLDRSAPFMDDIVVSKDGVTKLLKGLNPSKALVPDEFHPRVLKELATVRSSTCSSFSAIN